MRGFLFLLLASACSETPQTDTQSAPDTDTADTAGTEDTDTEDTDTEDTDTEDTDTEDTDTADTDTEDPDTRNGSYTGPFTIEVSAISDPSLGDTCSGTISLTYDGTLANNEISGTCECTWTGLLDGSIEGLGTIYGRSNTDGSLTGSLMMGANFPATWTGNWTDSSAFQASSNGTFSASTTTGSLPMNYTIAWTAAP